MPVMDMAQQQSTEDEALDLVVEQGRDHQEHPIGQNDGISAARQKSPEQQQKCTPEKLQKTENSEPHTTLSEVEKRLVIVIASFAAFISPISASIYYPALDPLASDLGVTPSTINLTITAYMVIPFPPFFLSLRYTSSDTKLDISSSRTHNNREYLGHSRPTPRILDLLHNLYRRKHRPSPTVQLRSTTRPPLSPELGK